MSNWLLGETYSVLKGSRTFCMTPSHSYRFIGVLEGSRYLVWMAVLHFSTSASSVLPSGEPFLMSSRV